MTSGASNENGVALWHKEDPEHNQHQNEGNIQKELDLLRSRPFEDLEKSERYAELCKFIVENEELEVIKVMSIENEPTSDSLEAKPRIESFRATIDHWGESKNMKLTIGRTSKDGTNVYIRCQEGCGGQI